MARKLQTNTEERFFRSVALVREYKAQTSNALASLYEALVDALLTAYTRAASDHPKLDPKLRELTRLSIALERWAAKQEVPPRAYIHDVSTITPVQSRRSALAALYTAVQAAEASRERLRQQAAVQPISPPLLPGQVDDVDGYDLKPDPLTARTASELVDRMQQFRIWAGDAPIRKLARESGGRLPASTLAKVLKGTALPPLPLLIAFVEVCGGDDGEVSRWATAWRQLRMSPDKRKNNPSATVTPLPKSTRSAG